MDPITGTIVWGVVWFFAGSLGAVLIYVVAFAIGAAVSDDDEGGAFFVAIFIGWLLAIAWEIYVFIQVVFHIVQLVQLLTA